MLTNKKEMEDTIVLLQDNLDDAWKWDANNNDILNEELSMIQDRIDQLKEKFRIL